MYIKNVSGYAVSHDLSPRANMDLKPETICDNTGNLCMDMNCPKTLAKSIAT